MFKTAIIVAFLLTCHAASSQTIQLFSPDNNLRYSFRRTKTAVVYSVHYKGAERLKDQALWLGYKEGTIFNKTLSLGKRTFNQQNVLYKEVIIPIKEREGLRRTVILIVRAYNDKIIYKYENPNNLDDNFMAINPDTQKENSWQSCFVNTSSKKPLKI
jgi:hypothetical protein